jgi:hypothetical protein
LIVTGTPNDNGTKTEILDLDDPTNICTSMGDYPIKVRYSVGAGLLNGSVPIICGGYSDAFENPIVNACYVYPFINNTPSMELIDGRYHAAITKINETTLWITGGVANNRLGSGGRYYYVSTTEFISIGQPTIKGPDLPFAYQGAHCILKINETTFLLATGYANNTLTKSTFYIDTIDWIWTRGPDVIEGRRGAACGVFNSPAHGNRPVAVIAGVGNGGSDTVELLDLSTNTWIQGTITKISKYSGVPNAPVFFILIYKGCVVPRSINLLKYFNW